MNTIETLTSYGMDPDYQRAQLRFDLIKAASSNSSCDHPGAAIEFADAVLARMEKEGEM